MSHEGGGESGGGQGGTGRASGMRETCVAFSAPRHALVPWMARRGRLMGAVFGRPLRRNCTTCWGKGVRAVHYLSIATAHTCSGAPAAATTRPGTANTRRPEARSTYTPRVDGDHLVDVVGHGYHDELGNLLPRYRNRPSYAGCRNHAFVPGFEQESAWL